MHSFSHKPRSAKKTATAAVQPVTKGKTKPKKTKAVKKTKAKPPKPTKEKKPMSRPNNEAQYNKDPELEPGTEAAVANITAIHPSWKVLEAKVNKDTEGNVNGYELTVGERMPDGATYEIHEIRLDASLAVTGQESRPNVPPGQEKKGERGEHGHGQHDVKHEGKHDSPHESRQEDHTKAAQAAQHKKSTG